MRQWVRQVALAVALMCAPRAALAGSTTHYFYDSAGRYVGHTTTGIDVRSNTYDAADNRSYYQLLVPNTAPVGAGLANNQSIFQGQTLSSTGGVYNLIFQEDGNVVLYHGSTGLWSTQTSAAAGSPGATLLMQTDGNLCVYDPQWVVRWCSNTAGNPGATLVVQGDGNMVIYASNHTTPLWATNTAGQ